MSRHSRAGKREGREQSSVRRVKVEGDNRVVVEVQSANGTAVITVRRAPTIKPARKCESVNTSALQTALNFVPAT